MLGVVCISKISESLRYRADSEGSCFLISGLGIKNMLVVEYGFVDVSSACMHYTTI